MKIVHEKIGTKVILKILQNKCVLKKINEK